ncbi:Tfp pilus assembly protein PilF [Paucibacter oligotrophus]|uniref:Tfp pilus assembly protein PilF n=1 Tax=Roseateles oligotrophus TaxID=1769250 RepID=A0A840L449_9BURK|nr:multiheme c-type cytochrome [Roseateles oligotrophus]MBB4842571.1 Tfp pilus assembly protein PilF [Roseateles oligotrophus]
MSKAKRVRPSSQASPAATPSSAPTSGLRRHLPWLLAALLLLLVAATGLAWLRGLGESTARPATASSEPGLALPGHADYVDNQQCLGCHAQQAELWRQSHHAKAMAEATPASVRGDFKDRSFSHQGITSRFFRRDGKYMVRTDGPDGRMADFEIKYSFGFEPLQQYLIELPGGRLQALQIAWDTRQQRWFQLQPQEKTPAGDVLHWTGRYQTANTMCIGCHTTNYVKNYDAASDRFASRWSESNVSCQACHGPGRQHIEWAGKPQQAGVAAPPGLGFRMDLRKAGAAQNGELCMACHARRSELDAQPLPGQPLLDQVQPSLLSAGLYHPDGQQLDEVFVYGSYRQSKMYQRGVSCTHCHSAHSGKPKLAGNALCLQCHAPASQASTPGFASAAGDYERPAHHFHKPGSAGAQCVACHMPAKTYMQIQARPDHSLRIPRPDLSLKLGTPNACNQCHQDKPAQWALERIEQWYGKKQRPPHYGEVLAAARSGAAEAGPALAELAGQLSQPAIVRATALAELRQAAELGLDSKASAARDADPELRAAAATSLENAPPAQRLQILTPLLSDPLRAVRAAAARSLSSLPAEQLPATFKPALAEYMAAQEQAQDMPGARLNLAAVHENQGRTELAEQQYLGALRLDPDFTPARLNLSRLYGGSGRPSQAEALLRAGLQRLPRQGELHYNLGLLLAEEKKRLPEAAEALARAAELLPERSRVFYNLGLARQAQGRRAQAEQALLSAARLAPADPDPAYALALLYAQGAEPAKALVWAQRLRRPGQAPDPQLEAFIAELTKKAG